MSRLLFVEVSVYELAVSGGFIVPENFQLYIEVQGRVTPESLDGVIASVSDRLTSSEDSPFKEAARAKFTNTLDEVHAWLDVSATEFAEEVNVGFIYGEMNGFDINPDRWFCDLFGYSREIDYRDPYDRSQYDTAIASSEDALTLTGMESMQRAFEWRRDNEHLGAAHADAETLAQLLVECRFIELLRNACAVGPLQPDVPVAVAAHDSEMVLRVR